MTKIIDRTGAGAALTAAQNDANLSSLSGINEAQTGTTYTVTIDDQNRTIELSNASAITVTLTAIATITGSLHTDDFTVTLKNIGAGLVTINRGSTDTFDDGSTSHTLFTGQSVTIQTDSTGAIWNVIQSHQGTIVTGTITSASLTANIWDAVQSITHNLGTDNVIFGATVKGNGSGLNPPLGTVFMIGTDNRNWTGGDPLYTSLAYPPAIVGSSSGDVDIYLGNTGATQTITCVYWIRPANG